MKLIIANRVDKQVGINLDFSVTFKCSHCNKIVEPGELQIGRAHVYAIHCGAAQEVGIVA